jgi:hypothetical protein
MERKEVMGKNVAIYKGQASALEEHANPGCKVGLSVVALTPRCQISYMDQYWMSSVGTVFCPLQNDGSEKCCTLRAGGGGGEPGQHQRADPQQLRGGAVHVECN